MINPDDLLWFGLLDSWYFLILFVFHPTSPFFYSTLKRPPKMRARKSWGKDPPWTILLKDFWLFCVVFPQESALNVPFSGYNHLIISSKCHNLQGVKSTRNRASGASGDGGWEDCELTESGHFVRRFLVVFFGGSPMKIISHQAMDFINGWDWEMIPWNWEMIPIFYEDPPFLNTSRFFWGMNPARSTLLKEPMLDPLPEPCPRLVSLQMGTVDPPRHGRSNREQHD